LSRRKIVLGAVFAIVAVLMIAGVLAVITSTRTIPSSGTIRGVNLYIYSDSALHNAVTSIDWGTADSGATVDRTIYIWNNGTSSMTLGLSTANWIPSNATNALSISWDAGGATVTANSTQQATLTLHVDPSFTTGMTFSVDITITGTIV